MEKTPSVKEKAKEKMKGRKRHERP
jgi:hypothetical protein